MNEYPCPILTRVTPETRRDLEELAAVQRTTLTELIRRAIDHYLYGGAPVTEARKSRAA